MPVTDWARFLPLSNRDRDGENAVTRNWSPATAQLLEGIAAVLDAHPDLLASATLRPTVTTAAAVRQMLTDLGAPWWMRWARSLGAAETTSPAIAAIDDDALVSAVRARAVTRAAPGVRTSIRDLGVVLVLALELRAIHSAPLEVDPFWCGAVALDLAMRVPQPQRSVVTARTFVAVDSDWCIGRGPALHVSAASIVLFLAGRGAVPPEGLESSHSA